MLAGIYQILHTPFAETGAIDWASYERQIDFCLQAGVHGLVTPAMASEFFAQPHTPNLVEIDCHRPSHQIYFVSLNRQLWLCPE